MYPHPPLVNRIARTESIPPSIFPQHHANVSVPHGVYRTWDDISLMNAMSAVERGTASLRKSAEMYKIPLSTLHDHVSGKVAYGARSGPNPYLTNEEEEELASFLIQVATIGYPHTKTQVLAVVQQIIDGKGIKTTITNGWWERFCHRHPNITLRAAVPLSLARAMATDVGVINEYFNMLEKCLSENKIVDKPGLIFNCDETGLPLNPTCQKVVDRVGAKNPSYITSGNRSQITVLACSCAAGFTIPPFVIFDRKTLNPKLTVGEVPGTLYGLSHNGWMNSELFFHWFKYHFLQYAPQTRPLILLLDGHSSYYCPAVIRSAAESSVVIFALPPHTTHIVQPLDKGCFSPLKAAWRQVCHDYCSKNPGKTVTRYEFNHLFSDAWFKSMTATNIISSFKSTGICPFDRSAIKLPGKEKVVSSSFKPESLAQKTGLAFIPLYSPLRKPTEGLKFSTCPAFDLDASSDSSTGDENCNHQDFSFESAPLRRATSVSNFLIPPLPPNKIPTVRGKSPGCVLTSLQNIENLNEKERKKKEAEEKKQERKMERLKKKELKVELAREKAEKKGKKLEAKQGV